MNVSQAAMIALTGIAVVYLVLKFGRAIAALIAIAAIVLIGIGVLIFSFQGFNNQILVATVQASPVVNQPHEMAVLLTTYDGAGEPTKHSYELGGDRWLLQCQTVEYQPWLLALGIHSGYHLQRLEGEYDSAQANSQAVQIGSWSWFNSLANNVGFFSPVIRSAYGNGVIEPADGTVYNVYADGSGDLYANRA